MPRRERTSKVELLSVEIHTPPGLSKDFHVLLTRRGASPGCCPTKEKQCTLAQASQGEKILREYAKDHVVFSLL